MRLIDADALIELIEEKMFNSENMCPVIKMTEVLEIIEEQPTAYDVDNIVEQLDDFKTTVYSEILDEDVEVINLDRAKQIVRKGGVYHE